MTLDEYVTRDISTAGMARAIDLCLACVEHGEESEEFHQQLRLVALEYDLMDVLKAVMCVGLAQPSKVMDPVATLHQLRETRLMWAKERTEPPGAVLDDIEERADG